VCSADLGQSAALFEALAATYQSGAVSEPGLNPDIVIECTGVAALILAAAETAAPGAIICLTGVGPPVTPISQPTGLMSEAVLKNLVVFGSVNANRRHYYLAAQVLARADRAWLEQVVTRRVRPDRFEQALARESDDIKVVIEFADASG
jgi:glucose 1-dehydrogenase